MNKKRIIQRKDAQEQLKGMFWVTIKITELRVNKCEQFYDLISNYL